MRLLKENRNLLDNYHVKSGIYHYYRGEFGPAVDFFRKALDGEELTSSDRRIARYYLTMTLTESAERREEKSEFAEAILEYVHAVEVSPTYPDIRLRYGVLLEKVGRLEEAAEQYRKAIEINRSFLDAWIALGFTLLKSGLRDQAADAFRSACELKLDRTRAPFEAGLEALVRADDEESTKRLHQAFLYVPEVFEQRHRAALARLKAEEYEEALVELDAAIDLNPLYPDLYNFKGIALAELGRVDEALEAFEASSRLTPKFMVPRLNHAFALLRAGRFKEAETELEAILEDDPTEPAARAKLEELQSGARPEKRRNPTRGGTR